MVWLVALSGDEIPADVLTGSITVTVHEGRVDVVFADGGADTVRLGESVDGPRWTGNLPDRRTEKSSRHNPSIH